MITSALRRIVLAVVFAAPFAAVAGVPAAPQAKGPAAPWQAWEDLMDKIYTDGVMAKDGASQQLSGTVGARIAAHTNHTALVFLAPDKNNELAATGAGLGITKFTPTGKAGEFRTEGWVLVLSQFGDVTEAHRTESLGSYAAGFRQTKTEKLDLADPVVKARLDESIRYWIPS